MSFTPITSSQAISYAYNHASYRNANREAQWGSPVYFTPSNWAYGQGGAYGGPKYQEYYNYNNSPSTSLGNCTWWCCGRSEEANGIVLDSLGNANTWYTRYGGNKSTNIANLQAGDVIVMTDSGLGHVMFVEQISGTTVTISESADSQRSIWTGKACLVTSYSTSELTVGSSVDIYKNLDSAYYCTVVGYLHCGGSSSTYTLSLNVNPSGSGYFTGDPAGTYNAGDSITITANANAGYTFLKLVNEQGDVYTNPTITRTMNRNRIYTAYFSNDEETTEYIACQMAIKKKKGQINEISIYL